MAYKYNFKQREAWIKSFQPHYESQHWHKNKVYHPTELKNFKFFKGHKGYQAKINPKDIIGIKYDYGYNCPSLGEKNVTWSYMLQELKRLDWVIDNCKDKNSLITHIHKNKASKNVLKFGNHYFTTSGQHRLCMAKYLELDQVEVYVWEHKLDRELFVREKFIEKNYPKLVELGFVNDSYKAELDSEVLMLKIGGKEIWIRKKLIRTVLDRYKLLNRRKHKAIPNIIRGFYKPVKKHYKSADELYVLDYSMIKHIIKKVRS